MCSQSHATTFPSHGDALMCHVLTVPEVHQSLDRKFVGTMVRSEQTHHDGKPASASLMKILDHVQS